MSVVRGFLAVVLGAVCLIGTVGNMVVSWRLVVRKREEETRTPSILPLVAGVSGALAVLLWPYRALLPFVWVPLLLDPGTLPYVVFGTVAMLREQWTAQSETYLEAFRSVDAEGTTINLTLYPKGRFVAVKAIPPRTRISTGGRWRSAEEMLLLELGGVEIAFKAVPESSRKDKRVGDVRSEYTWESSSSPTILDGITLTRHEAERLAPHRDYS